MNVLIISASMGAGHDGAARELKKRLESQGDHAEVKDFLKAFPLGIGRIVRMSYEWELKWAPWSYEATYRMWYRLPSLTAPLVTLLNILTRWRVNRWIAETDADAVVSTYPLASLTLGGARQSGKLLLPTATYITDFAVHPLWTHPGVDLHMTVHPQSAAAAHEATGGRVSAPGPLVSQRFRSAFPDRIEARAKLGIAPDEKVVLLVAGSWGVGAITRTFDDVVATGAWTPLAVCGNNARLKRRLNAKGVGRVIGWSDEMPTLMAASDVLVENAGGLTCMEAFAAGLPVVSYRSIAGHGKGNAKDMEAAGVAAIATVGHLRETLDATMTPAGLQRVQAGKAMLSGDAADEVIELARRPIPIPEPRRHRVLRPAAIAAATVGAVFSALIATSLGAGIAAAHGVAVAHPPRHAEAAFVAIRVSRAEVEDPAVISALAADHVSAVVSGLMAEQNPALVAKLSSAGVDVANGGWGQHRGHTLSWANADVLRSARAIHEATGAKVTTFVANHVDGFALASAELDNQRVVLTHTVINNTVIPALKVGSIYCIDARQFSAADVLSVLQQIAAQQAHGTVVDPLSSLAK